MTTHIISRVVEEIALEGPFGITLPSLAVRLKSADGFPVVVSEKSMSIIWSVLLTSPSLSFHLLHQPRPDVVSFDRCVSGFDTDPGVDIHDDPYPFKCSESIAGDEITEKIRQKSPAYERVMAKYERRLVVVADKKTRDNILSDSKPYILENLSELQMSALIFIARRRSSGATSLPAEKLVTLLGNAKTFFLVKRILTDLGLITSQIHFVTREERFQSCSLLMLTKFKKAYSIPYLSRLFDILKFMQNVKMSRVPVVFICKKFNINKSRLNHLARLSSGILEFSLKVPLTEILEPLYKPTPANKLTPEERATLEDVCVHLFSSRDLERVQWSRQLKCVYITQHTESEEQLRQHILTRMQTQEQVTEDTASTSVVLDASGHHEDSGPEEDHSMTVGDMSFASLSQASEASMGPASDVLCDELVSLQRQVVCYLHDRPSTETQVARGTGLPYFKVKNIIKMLTAPPRNVLTSKLLTKNRAKMLIHYVKGDTPNVALSLNAKERRMNFIQEYLQRHEVVQWKDDLLYVIRIRERAMGSKELMDKKSLHRILRDMNERGLINLFSPDENTELAALPHITPDHYKVALQFSKKSTATTEGSAMPRHPPDLGDKNFYNFGEMGKFVKLRLLHQFLWYLRFGISADSVYSVVDVPGHPRAYVDEVSWRRFVAPVYLTHGCWMSFENVFFALPLKILCSLTCLRHDLPLIHQLLSDPVLQFTPLGQLEERWRHYFAGSSYYRSAVGRVLHMLAVQGLVTLTDGMSARSTYRYMEIRICFHRHAALLDTRTSDPGYLTVTKKVYPEMHFQLDTMADLQSYWCTFKHVSIYTPLGYRGCSKDGDNASSQLEHVKPACLSYSSALSENANWEETLYLPWVHAQRVGACGMPNSLISYRLRDWNHTNGGCRMLQFDSDMPFTMVSDLFEGQETCLHPLIAEEVGSPMAPKERAKSVVRMKTMHKLCVKKTALGDQALENVRKRRARALKQKTNSPHPPRKRRCLDSSDGSIVKGSVRKREDFDMEGGDVEDEMEDMEDVEEGPSTSSVGLMGPPKTTVSARKQRRNRHDILDNQLIAVNKGRRAQWSKLEDSFLCMVRVTSLILVGRQCRTLVCISCVFLRDLLRRHCGQQSFLKTSGAVRRRIHFLCGKPEDSTRMSVFHSRAQLDPEFEPYLKYDARQWNKLKNTDVGQAEQLFSDVLGKVMERFQFERPVLLLPDSVEALLAQYQVKEMEEQKQYKCLTDHNNVHSINMSTLFSCILSYLLPQEVNEYRDMAYDSLFTGYPRELVDATIHFQRVNGVIVHRTKSAMPVSKYPMKMVLANRVKISQSFDMRCIDSNISLTCSEVDAPSIPTVFLSHAFNSTCDLLAQASKITPMGGDGDGEDELRYLILPPSSHSGVISLLLHLIHTAGMHSILFEFSVCNVRHVDSRLQSLPLRDRLLASRYDRNHRLAEGRLLVDNWAPVCSTDGIPTKHPTVTDLLNHEVETMRVKARDYIREEECHVLQAPNFVPWSRSGAEEGRLPRAVESLSTVEKAVTEWIEEKKEAGRTLSEIKANFTFPVETVLKRLIEMNILYEVGLMEVCFVHHMHLRPWLLPRKMYPNEPDQIDSSPKATQERLFCFPEVWRNVDGRILPMVLDALLEKVASKLIKRVTISFENLLENFSRFLQPATLRSLVKILHDIGALEFSNMKEFGQSALFSHRRVYETVPFDFLENETMLTMRSDAILKIAAFVEELKSSGASNATNMMNVTEEAQ